MAFSLLQPWTWFNFGSNGLPPGAQSGDNFIRNLHFDAPSGRSGVVVSSANAYQVAALQCGIRVIAEGVAQIPLKVYKESYDNGVPVRQPAVDSPLYALLNRRPNAWMTSFEWRETMTMHAVLNGNGYSYISRVNGVPDELIPMASDTTMLVMDSNGVVGYRAFILGTNRQIDVPFEDMFHLRGPSLDGRLGMKVINTAREILGLSIALDQQQADLQRNGGRLSGVLSFEDKLAPEKVRDLREVWNARFGAGGEGGVAVLDSKAKFDPMSSSMLDQQAIEHRKFQVEEVARVLRVLPLMLMQGDKASTYASSEQFFLAHVVHTLGPWFERWEQALDRDVITDPGLYARFSVEGLLRGAATDRANYYSKALGSGGTPAWMTQNDIRVLEHMNPVDGGDQLFAGMGALPVPSETENQGA